MDRKPVIIFDFDRTLFDTKTFLRRSTESLASIYKLELETLKNIRDQYINSLANTTDFNLSGYSDYLEMHLGISATSVLEAFSKNEDWYLKSLYPGTLETLKNISEKAILGIFSEGHLEYQNHKIDNSNILHFFNPKFVFIHRNKLNDSALGQLPEEAIVVDDKISILEALLAYKVKPIWINRSSKEKHPVITTIFSLDELEFLL